MSEAPPYAVLGRGRWAGRMLGVLSGEGRRTACVEETRRYPDESDADYKSRLLKSIQSSGARVVWLCVHPGPHIPLIVDAALDAGVHIVVEKPWLCAHEQTAVLLAKARSLHLLVGVHYEYCLLSGVEDLRRNFDCGRRLRFCGRFMINRPQRLGVSALEDLGSHLLAIRAYAVPDSILWDVRCGYELPDERRVWLESNHESVVSVDFLANQEPVIQRFIGRFEAAMGGAEFPFDLEFASRVADDLQSFKWHSSH